MNLFEYAEAQAAKEEGIESSSAHAGEDWNEYAKEFVRAYLEKNATLFGDDLWGHGLEEPPTKSALGAVVVYATKQGWIEQMTHNGYILGRTSTRGHLQLKPVWRSLLYETTK